MIQNKAKNKKEELFKRIEELEYLKRCLEKQNLGLQMKLDKIQSILGED